MKESVSDVAWGMRQVGVSDYKDTRENFFVMNDCVGVAWGLMEPVTVITDPISFPFPTVPPVLQDRKHPPIDREFPS